MNWEDGLFEDDPDLRALRDEYAAALPEKIAEIGNFWSQLQAGDWDGSVATTVMRRCHDLSGSAASYGFPTISVISRLIEQDLKHQESLDHLPAASLMAGIAVNVAELRNAVHFLHSRAEPVAVEKVHGSVLIIDDDASVRALLAALLRRKGFEVRTEETGDDGLKYATEAVPDLILLDVSMPGMDGYEACFRLQNGRATYHIPIVFVTAHEDDQDKARAFAVGAADYLIKPVTEESLLATVRRCLSRNQRWKSLQDDVPVPVGVETRMTLDFSRFKDYLVGQTALPPHESARLTRMGWAELLVTAAEVGVASNDLATLIAGYSGLRYLPQIDATQVRLGAFPVSFCRSNQVIALIGDGGRTDFVTSNPFNPALLEGIDRSFAGIAGEICIAEPKDIQALLEYRPQPAEAPKTTKGTKPLTDMATIEAQLRQTYKIEEVPLSGSDTGGERSAPIILLVNNVIETAYEMGASDIHIEPWENEVVVRYRVDGQLIIANRFQPQRLIFPLIARLKVMAGLDITERRMPQDGRIVYREFARGRADFDLRVSTAPMNFGEKVVMRIIDKQKSVRPLAELGLSAYNLARYRTKITAPYGMILHVGPTGSGKSMTLYSALNEIQTPAVNIQTAEDPIEYTLAGINQLQVKPDIGLTFARALRSFLRQDPDVILIGEIRDWETAEVAVEAAMTGHLLLSTLHTNDAAATVARFLEMGIEPYMISATVLMVCAQRLLRRLCPACKVPQILDERALAMLGLTGRTPPPVFQAGPGCGACRQIGFAGRIGIHELLIPDDGMRTLISQPGVTAMQLKRAAVAAGMVTLYWDAMDKVRAGLCSLDDVLSQVMPDEFETQPAGW
ncbi:MAG: Flp pilus assembly complex ATPase component TadA [Candidatus Sericytochromatia bacterium]|nr:Flp pilus assembly complex ATPase component TadA [Candidatus Sericytochromatia bacterium]